MNLCISDRFISYCFAHYKNIILVCDWKLPFGCHMVAIWVTFGDIWGRFIVFTFFLYSIALIIIFFIISSIYLWEVYRMNTSFNPISSLSKINSYSFSSVEKNTESINDLSKKFDVTPVPDQNEVKHDELIRIDYALGGEMGNPSKPYCQFYKPVNYSDADPVFVAQFYPWDDSEPVTREIHLKDIDFSYTDRYEAFAYGIYLEEQGKNSYLDDMVIAFDHANANMPDNTSNFNKVDLIGSIKEFMNEGLKHGYYEQYIHYLTIFNSIKGAKL